MSAFGGKAEVIFSVFGSFPPATMAALALQGAVIVIRQSLSELRQPAPSIA